MSILLDECNTIDLSHRPVSSMSFKSRLASLLNSLEYARYPQNDIEGVKHRVYENFPGFSQPQKYCFNIID